MAPNNDWHKTVVLKDLPMHAKQYEKIKALQKMCISLQAALDLYEKQKESPLVLTYQDSLIQRMQYTLINCIYLINTYYQDAFLHSQKGVEEIKMLLKMKESIPGAYRQEIADEITKHAPQSLKTMQKIVSRLTSLHK